MDPKRGTTRRRCAMAPAPGARLSPRDDRGLRLAGRSRPHRGRRRRERRRVSGDGRARPPARGAPMVPLNSIAAVGVLLGALLGLGLWLILSAVPRVGRPRLIERVAPYVSDISPEARTLLARRPADPTPVLGLIVIPLTRS